jgi:hypothetical protein
MGRVTVDHSVEFDYELEGSGRDTSNYPYIQEEIKTYTTLTVHVQNIWHSAASKPNLGAHPTGSKCNQLIFDDVFRSRKYAKNF